MAVFTFVVAGAVGNGPAAFEFFRGIAWLGKAWLGVARLGMAMQGKARKKGENMSTINVKIQGTTPLLMNRFTDEAEMKVSSGVSTVAIGKKGTPREQAEKKAYMDEKGMLYIPGPNIFSCLIQAGKFFKQGKVKVTTTKNSLVPAGMAVREIVCSLCTKEWEVDSRSVVIPATGGRIMAHRPRLDEWAVSFSLDVDDAMFTTEFVRQLVDDAGRKIGLGDFRPDRKGPFGKFVVVGWEVEKAKKAA